MSIANLNYPVFTELRFQIEKFEDEHQQGHWVHGDMDRYIEFLGQHKGKVRDVTFAEIKECGTTACVAGWAALLGGWRPTTSQCEGVVTDVDWSYLASPKGQQPKVKEPASIAALKVLGLDLEDITFKTTRVDDDGDDYETTVDLFDGTNTREEIIGWFDRTEAEYQALSV